MPAHRRAQQPGGHAEDVLRFIAWPACTQELQGAAHLVQQ